MLLADISLIAAADTRAGFLAAFSFSRLRFISAAAILH